MASTTQYTLDQYKTDAQKQIEEKRRNSQQAADINYQKLQKYLPQQTKGYSIGMTETAKIAANNAYQRQLAQAESDYNADMTELNNYVRTEQERLDDKAKAEQERLDDKAKAEQERLDDKAKAEQDKLFNEAKGIIEGGAWNTGSELQNYISGLESRLSEDQYGVLKQYAGSIANNREQKAAEIEQSKAYNEDGTTRIEAKTSAKAILDGYLSNIKAGNDFKVGGYKVELGDKVDTKVVPSEATSSIKDKEVFAYDGSLYIKIGNDIYLVRDRNHQYGSDDYKGALALFT